MFIMFMYSEKSLKLSNTNNRLLLDYIVLRIPLSDKKDPYKVVPGHCHNGITFLTVTILIDEKYNF